MATGEHLSPRAKKPLLCGGAILEATAAVTILLMQRTSTPTKVAANSVYVERLRIAHHYKSTFPAQRQTVDLLHKVGVRSAALNAIGEEPREVGGMADGNPNNVFAMLSHLGGLGEVIWVDDWTNFPVKLPASSRPGAVVVPRRAAVRAALNAIEASGACLIKAGKNRTLVAKSSEKGEYEAAIRALGWLDGKPAPWDTENNINAPSQSQPVRPGTNQASAAAGSGR